MYLNNKLFNGRRVHYFDNFDRDDADANLIAQRMAGRLGNDQIARANSFVCAHSAFARSPGCAKLVVADQSAFYALWHNRPFRSAIKRQKVGLVVALGSNSGLRVGHPIKYLLAMEQWPSLLVVDNTKPMLTTAFRRLSKENEWPVLNEVGAMRCELRNLKDVRSQLPGEFVVNSEATLFALLFNTFAELPAGEAIELLKRNARIGDLVLISLELAKTRECDRLDPNAALGTYQGARPLWECGAAMNGGGGRVSCTIERNEGRKDFAIVAKHHHCGGTTEIFRTARYEEADVLEMMGRAGFELVTSQTSPLHRTWKYLVFRRIQNPEISVCAAARNYAGGGAAAMVDLSSL